MHKNIIKILCYNLINQSTHKSVDDDVGISFLVRILQSTLIHLLLMRVWFLVMWTLLYT